MVRARSAPHFARVLMALSDGTWPRLISGAKIRSGAFEARPDARPRARPDATVRAVATGAGGTVLAATATGAISGTPAGTPLGTLSASVRPTIFCVRRYPRAAHLAHDAALERRLRRGLDGGAVHHRVGVGRPTSITSQPASTIAFIASMAPVTSGSRRVGSRPARRARPPGPSRRRRRCSRLTVPSDVSQPEPLDRGAHVLVAAAGEVDQQGLAGPLRGQPEVPATAWADSIAGMIPSVRASSAIASIASVSVTAR